MIPDGVLREVAVALEERGAGPGELEDAGAVGGGCINPSTRLRSGGDDFFLKWNPDAPPGIFAAEADGLEALASVAAVRTPEVVALGSGEAGCAPWLLLEFVPRGAGGPGWDEDLGARIADLHRSGGGTDARFGWHRDNWIGALPQDNGPTASWTDFWRDRRILPQLRKARDRGFVSGDGARDLDRVVERMDEALGDASREAPALLHGDLWGGNVYPGPGDEPVVVDPAVYTGHREVDLAMSELFGFPAGFMGAYREAWPVDPGYDRVRRDLYQLYYLLVHVNLFGAGYVPGCLGAARRVLAGL